MMKQDHSRETPLTGSFGAFSGTLVAVLLLLAAVPTKASLSVVQAGNTNSTATKTTLAVTLTTSANNLLVVFESNGTGTTNNATPTDSASNTYTFVSSSTTGAQELSLYYAKSAAAVTSVNGNWSPTSVDVGVVVYEVAGADTVSPLDAHVELSNGTATTALLSGNLTTTNANDILIYGNGWGTVQASPFITPGTGYTLPTNGAGKWIGAVYQVVSSVQTNTNTTSTAQTSTAYTSVFAAFKAAAGGAAPTGANKREKLEQADPSS